MQHFFVNKEAIEGEVIRITGGDVKHISQVLRMKIGEEAFVSDGSFFYQGKIQRVSKEEVLFQVASKRQIDTELPVKITLFQGHPKQDKLEVIIQKSVELGVYQVVPVETKRTVVKLDEKKRLRRQERWQKVSESAAKQSGRGLIPEVTSPLSFKEAVQMASQLDTVLVPYEEAGDIGHTRAVLEEVSSGERLGVFIGPEGGFSREEIEVLEGEGAKVITLGSRILRTETAGPAVLSVLSYLFEGR
ncbi:16S rRNA (uracil(1498)-N(3))-methyltransferase [Ohessyouella blattaphilus]|uniref:Ribosomal RNA small subunit methyltransferase E n=1 Tax=Ohessyouella blattaphilus TaxID=2949333 RepID=A0ABT1EGY8_9FIRM|nr:16S rRNA (uracil(1498)-N(3))-methyltransferase [Ohessyouella blattaphilus]MCP1109953.1 16S rRNA (uracil(1498)-N(3))-methyltransferase [Ohessyouella blattaphilus]MCR8563347.1 16S rRNA (uracil(1498)-N(3))-methyltransferase [Ohessyouella blattaphilus]